MVKRVASRLFDPIVEWVVVGVAAWFVFFVSFLSVCRFARQEYGRIWCDFWTPELPPVPTIETTHLLDMSNATKESL